MRKQVKISVTQEDIQLGVKEDIHHCAVARAAQRVLGDTVTVGGSYIHLRQPCPGNCISMPQEVIDWISAFDHGKDVTPFEFEVVWEGGEQIAQAS